VGHQPIAVADLGGNTLHLLIATVEHGHVRELLDETEMIRLGEDVDRGGAISEAKIAASLDVLDRFKHHAACFGAARLHLMATQAVRGATNRDDFLRRIHDSTGLEVTLLTSRDEAQLAFDGVVLSKRHSPCEGRPDQAYMIVDVGGSTSHCVVGRGRTLIDIRSIPLGSGKLTTLHGGGDPPTDAQIEAMTAAVEAALVPVDATFGDGLQPQAAFAVGGSARALKKLANLPLAGEPIGVIRLMGMLATLRRQNATAIANAFDINRARARVLPAGVILIERILHHFGLTEIRIKLSGIRDGAVLRIARCGHLSAEC